MCIRDRYWGTPITVDAAWKNGAYALDEQPLKGLTAAYRLVSVTALSPAFIDRNFGHTWADPKRDPRLALANEFKSHADLGAMAAANAALSDANHFLYMLRACCTYNVLPRIGDARAKFLFLPVESDLVFPPFMSQRAVDEIRAAGGRAELEMLKADGGHFLSLIHI